MNRLKVIASLKKANIPFTIKKGKIEITSSTACNNVKPDKIIAALKKANISFRKKGPYIEIKSLADEEQRALSSDDKGKILKAILSNANVYVMELPGYIKEQFDPEIIGLSADKMQHGEKYRDFITNQVTEMILEKVKFFTPVFKTTKLEVTKKEPIENDDTLEDNNVVDDDTDSVEDEEALDNEDEVIEDEDDEVRD